MKNCKVFFNGRIHTMDKRDSIYEAMVVKDSEILFLGTDEEALAYEADQRTDLGGRTVFPGFSESHTHAPGLAYDTLFNIDLYPALSEEEIMDKIREHVQAHPEKEMYYGRGFNTSLFHGIEGVIGPKKERLDEISPEKPVILSDFGGNCMWMNTAALKKYDITPDRECPPGGEIQLNPETGELWGIIRNEARGFVPYQEFTEEENYQAMKWFQEILLKNGYTSIFALRPPGTVEPRTTLFHAFKVLEDRGELKLRVHGARDIDALGDLDEQFEEMEATRKKVKSPLMDLTTAKFFLDGVVEGLDGYLLRPYTEEAGKGPDFTGNLFWEKEKLAVAFQKAMEHGFQIHCHSIGDGATHDALDAMEAALKNLPEGDYRNTLTHLQLVSDADIDRMKAMNIVANVQVYWHFKSPVMFPLETKLLGKQRAEREYPLNRFVKNGIKIVSSSDFPVTPEPNPFHAIEAGVTRNLFNAKSYGVEDIEDMDDERYLLDKEERVSLTEMIRSFTINAAYAKFLDQEIGSLETGKYADFIVLDKNPYEVDPVDLEYITVMETYFGGEKVYEKSDESES
ncbi:amidohydrolase family protein [bacterium 210820-DFI.6.37]|nr:amidohydrolase family protein [bacterium 210820-DFI.6.37]